MIEKICFEEVIRHFLRGLASIGPASSYMTQMLFLLPEKARIVLEAYQEIMEHEDEVRELFGLKYTEKGLLECSYGGLADHLRGLYRNFFSLLSDPQRRSQLLKLAGLSEEEFRDIDPLRFWLDSAIDYLAKERPSCLKVLDELLRRLEKEDYVYLSREELGKLKQVSKDPESDLEILDRFGFLYRERSDFVYKRECPLMLEAYTDLRARLRKFAGNSEVIA